MFYFAHPFGIQTPSIASGYGFEPSITASTSPTCEFFMGGRNSRQYRYNLKRQSSIYASSNGRRRTSLVPWPRNTWSRDSALPPLLQILARQHGELFIFTF